MSNQDTAVVHTKIVSIMEALKESEYSNIFSVDGFCRKEDGIWFLWALKQTCS